MQDRDKKTEEKTGKKSEKKPKYGILFMFLIVSFVLFVFGFFFCACRFWRFPLLVVSVVLLGICAMICQTVLHVEQMRSKASERANESLDDKIIEKILNS